MAKVKLEKWLELLSLCVSKGIFIQNFELNV